MAGKKPVKVFFDALLYETDNAWLVGNPEFGRNEKAEEPTDRVWLPRRYKDGKNLVSDKDIKHISNGVEVIMPEWLAESKGLIDHAYGLDPSDMVEAEPDDWMPEDDIPF